MILSTVLDKSIVVSVLANAIGRNYDTPKIENIVFSGSSTTSRSFDTKIDAQGIDPTADMYTLLKDQGIEGITLTTAARSGSSATYQAETLVPEMILEHGGLSKVLWWGQAPSNSMPGGDYATTDEGNKAALSTHLNSIFDQVNEAGWTPVYSNFNDTVNKNFDPRWNSEFLKPIVEIKAPESLVDGSFLQDYETLGGWSNYLFSSIDGIHLAEGSGDRLYRQFTATRVARYLGKDLRKDLSGRRVVFRMAGGVSPDLNITDNIAPLLSGYVGNSLLSVTGTAYDADTGEILPDLYLAVRGSTTTRGGRGNSGNTTSSYLNDLALSKSVRAPAGSAPLTVELGSFSQTLPTVASLILAGSTTLVNKITDWECQGTVKTLDAGTLPCGTVEFNDLTPIGNKINATGTVAVGAEHSYFSAVEVQFS